MKIPFTAQQPRDRYTWIVVAIAVLVVLPAFGLGVYRAAYAGRVYPNVVLGDMTLGGLSRDAAREKIESRAAVVKEKGIALNIGANQEALSAQDIRFEVDVEATLGAALAVGRQGAWHEQLVEGLTAPFRQHAIQAVVRYDENALVREVADIARLRDEEARDVRLSIRDGNVEVLTDTKAGTVIDQSELRASLQQALPELPVTRLSVKLRDVVPHINPATAETARKDAARIIATPLLLTYDQRGITVSPTMLGTWVISGADGDRLIADIDRQAVSAYVTRIAADVNTLPQNLEVKIEDGKVVDFVRPKSGVVLEENTTVDLIVKALEDRKAGQAVTKEIALPAVVKDPEAAASAQTLGVKERIGRATTPFAGSPANRIANIKNGTKFLTGRIVQPGEEFSTIKTLGTIDNTTGYLPELVIKGNRTIPEFGGGLCQVSTTLFRAVMNGGLPVTARRNHSYRVSYYEKDGEGRYIGPGLDATIYDPNPDFRFKNDTANAILIIGYVEGTNLTFELFGTKDGRKSVVDGPRTISQSPAGEPIYIETDTIPEGTKKQVEKPHPGGSAEATYTITYADGREAKQKFTSVYRPWPAQFLVGVAKTPSTTPTETGEPSGTTPAPTPAVQ